MRCVAFLAYSVYTVFTSYIVKRQYFDDRKAILILSDDMPEVMKVYDDVVQSNIWDIVIVINEHGKNKKYVAGQINKIIKDYDIAVFCVANLWRKATHYLSNALTEQQKLIMIDEGSATLDLESVYNYYKNNEDFLERCGEFRFDRVDAIIGAMPQLIKYPFDVIIKRLNIAKVYLQDQKRTIMELNSLFGYKHEGIMQDVIVIDSDFRGMMPYEKEKKMLAQLCKLLKNRQAWIKTKPCLGGAQFEDRYPLNDFVLFNQMIPFEVIYLNMIFHGDKIPDIIMFPTSIMMNLIHMDCSFRIKRGNIIVLYSLLIKHGIYLKEIRMQYLSFGKYLNPLLKRKMISDPKTWKKVNDLISYQVIE